MATIDGKTLTHERVVYEFSSIEDAEGFKVCVENGGDAEGCANKHNCLNKFAKKTPRP